MKAAYLNQYVLCASCLWQMYPDTSREYPIGEKRWVVYCVNKECPELNIRYVVHPTVELTRLSEEGNMTIELRRLEHADLNLLRELRNASADSFFDSGHITREAQEDWWYRHSSGGHSTLFFTIWLNNVTPVGFLSVKMIQLIDVGSVILRVNEVGNLLLAPAFRGRGIMQQALIEVRRFYDDLTFWVAHVKSTNTASLKVFSRQQFVQLDPTPTRRQKKAAILEA